MKLMYIKLAPDALPPTKAHPTDAGWDVCSREHKVLMPGERFNFSTGLAVQLVPDEADLGLGLSWYLRGADRSGLASRSGIHVLGGVIDAGYTGDVGIILLNTSLVNFSVTQGMKIGQLIPTAVWCVTTTEQCHAFDDTARGADGFGSSGF